MNCPEVQALLSAYYDGQLADDRQSYVREHLALCKRCTEELGAFEQLSTLTRDLQTPAPPESIWSQLETELDAETSSQPARGTPYLSLYKSRILAIAAMILLTLGAGWFTYGTWFGHGGHQEFAAEFGHYLKEFRDDPSQAQQMLVAKYEGQAVDTAQAIQLVGYRPATADRLNEKYNVKSTYVLTMPCCTCVQTVCERNDGSTIVIFEHDDEKPEWFSGRQETMANCSGKRCSLFDVNDRIAASWQSGTRHITVIGVRDVGEVGDLVAWLEGNQQDSSS